MNRELNSVETRYGSPVAYAVRRGAACCARAAKRVAESNRLWLAAFVSAALAFAGAAPMSVHAQEPSRFKTGTIIVRTSQGDENLRVSSNGCSGTVTGPGLFVGIGDGCWIWSDTGDVPRAMRVRIRTDAISFTRGGQDYVIHDAATVKQARDLFAPLEEIAGKQSALGAQQRALGERQREFGRQQREVKVKVPDMSADFTKVEADAKRMSEQGGTQSDLGDLQSELGELQSRIGDLQSQAGEMQSQLGEQQSELGEQQAVLAEEQSKLSRGAEVATEAVRKLNSLLDDAIRSGTAVKEQ